LRGGVSVDSARIAGLRSGVTRRRDDVANM
jgi:hypothetical protein